MGLGLVLGHVLWVVERVHRLSLLSRLLHGGRMRSRGVSLTLLPSCGARALGEPLSMLRSHGLVVGAHISIGPLIHSRSHGTILALISRVLATTIAPHALLGVLVGVWGLTGGRVRVSGRVAHIGIGLSLLLWMSHLGPTHPDMSQVVRGVLSRGRCHALRGVVLVHACCVRARRALHPTVVALRHLVAPHLVGTTLRGGLRIGRPVRLLCPAPSCCPWVGRVACVMGVGRVCGVVVVVGRHAIHGWVNICRPLTRTVLGHHSPRGSSTLIKASVRAVVVHLSHFWLSGAGSHHALVVRPIPLVLVVHGGIGLPRGRLLRITVAQTV